MPDGATVAEVRTLDPQSLSLAIDTFAGRALVVQPLVERPVAVQGDAHDSSRFPVEVLDTALLLLELFVVAGLASRLWEEQGAEEALGAIAVGMGELEGGVHAQPFGTQRHPIGSALAGGMAMRIEGNRRDTLLPSSALVDIPGVESGVSRQVVGEVLHVGDGLVIEGQKVGNVVHVERLGVLSQHHITIVRGGRGHHARAIAPEVLLAFLLGAIRLLLVGGALDADFAVWVACGLTVFAVAIFDGDARVVFLDPGIDMLDIKGEHLPQARDFFLEPLHPRDTQRDESKQTIRGATTCS